MKKRILASLMCVCLLVGLLPTAALATEDTAGEATACTVTEGCTLTAGHEGGCVLSDEAEDDPADTSSGEYDVEDDTTEIVPNQEETTAVDPVAEVQALIDALPDADTLAEMDEDEQAEAYEEVSAIYDAVYELTEDEAAELDVTALEEAAAFFTQQIMPLANTITSGTNCGIDWEYDNGVLTISAATSPESGYSPGQMKNDYGTFADTNNEYKDKTGFTSLTVNNINRVQYADTNTYLSDTPWKDLGNSITKIIIEGGVTNIGARAFRLPCAVEVSIPASVTQIGEYAFSDNPALSTVNWTGEWTDHTSIKFDGFSGCTALGQDMEFSAWLPDCFNDMNGQGVNGTAFSVDFTKLDAQMTAENFSYGNYAFQSMPNLTDATLSSKLGAHAFTGSGVTNITFDSTLTSIPTYSFENCTALTSVTIPTGIATIGGASFRGCTNLKSVTFEGTTCPTFDTSKTVFARVVLDTLNLSESTSISEAQKIISYFTATGGITATTRITPQKFADMVATDVTVDGSLGAAINHTNYPKVENLTITGESYTSGPENNTGNSYPFGHSDGGKSETIKNLTIDVRGTVTLNFGAFLRSTLETVKISANNLTFAGNSVFLNNNSLKRIDLTGVSSISVSNGITQLFNLTENTNLDRYFYFNDSNCRSVLSTSQVSNNTNTRYLIANGGAVTGDTDGFDAVTKDGYTAKWYEYKIGTTDYSNETTATAAEAGKTYIAVWTASSYTVDHALTFNTLTYGDAPAPKTITVNASEIENPSVTKVTGSDSFDAAVSGMTVTITPKENLPVGTYSETIIVTTGDGATHNVAVSLTVTKAGSTVTPDKSDITATYGDTITLTAKVQRTEAESSIALMSALDEVEFICGQTSLGTAEVTYDESGVGTATLEYDTREGGIPVNQKAWITAQYGGSLNLNGTSGNIISVTLSPASLTVTGLTATDRTYDGTVNVKLTGGTLTGIIGNDQVSATMPTIGTMENANAGDSKAVTVPTITLTGEDASKYTLTQPTNVTVNITAASSTVTITSSATDLTGGGTVTLTVSGVPEGGTVTVVQTDDQNSEAKTLSLTGNGSVSVSLENKTAKYTFTVSFASNGNQEGATASCEVTVTRRSSGGGGGGSSSGSSSSTTTETVTNKDGSKTTTVTDKKTGTVTETTKFKDGSTLVVETKKDGTVTTTETRTDGVKVKTVDEPREDVTATVTIPRSVGTATVTIPADVTPGTVAVDAKTGEVVKLSVPTEDGVTVKLDGSADLVLVDKSKDFTDTRNHWAEDAIDFATAHGMFGGTSATTFTPDGSMTRGMIAVVLHNFEDNPDHAFTSSFDDVHPDSWYADGIHWMVDNGIAGGYGNGKFGADDKITREQLATFLYRYADVMGYGTSGGASLSGFTDAGSVSGYATEAMQWAVGNGLIGGMGNGTLAPQGNATRAQVATILMRFVENLTK